MGHQVLLLIRFLFDLLLKLLEFIPYLLGLAFFFGDIGQLVYVFVAAGLGKMGDNLIIWGEFSI